MTTRIRDTLLTKVDHATDLLNHSLNRDDSTWKPAKPLRNIIATSLLTVASFAAPYALIYHAFTSEPDRIKPTNTEQSAETSYLNQNEQMDNVLSQYVSNSSDQYV